MDPQTVAARLGELQLVDVRYEDEWRAGHIEGALNIPEEDFDARVGELDRSRPVVTVCRAGPRSAEAAEWLRTLGYDAQNLDGGMLAWKWAGLPLTGAIAEPPPSDPQMQALHNDFLDIALAVQERFGVGAQPSEADILDFLRERMISEGKSPEEAEAVLAELAKE